MKKKLKIAQVAPLWFTVPPKGYGGIERIVKFLCDVLVDEGHEVTLFAAPGSKTKAKLISVYPKPLKEVGISWQDNTWNLRNLSLAYEMANRGKFDIVHTHLDLWSLFFNNIVKVPGVQTMHNPMKKTTSPEASADNRLRLYYELRKTQNLCFISKKARELTGIKFPKSRIVYNGIDISHFKFNSKPADHFVWIARVDKYKGIENAIEATEKFGGKLILAGRLDKTQEDYFKTKIKPHLGKKIKYIGELQEEQLSDFYGSAKALLYPIEWEEPFGLVVIEAMACGTPVIAYDRGSMAEIIDHGKTGFVVRDMEQLVAAMGKIDQLDRSHIRKQAEKKWSKERMVADYEKVYYEVIKGIRR